MSQLSERKEQFKLGFHWCSSCKKYKTLDSFTKLRSKWSGLSSICKACKKVYNAKSNPIMNPKNNPKNNKGFGKWMLSFNQGLYKIIDTFNDDEVVYIGETHSMGRRHYTHMSGVKAGGKRFLNRAITREEMKRYRFIAWIEEKNAVKRGILESTLIFQYQPALNTNYKKRKV